MVCPGSTGVAWSSVLIVTGTDGRRRAGVGGQNCDVVLLTARLLTGHAPPVRRQQAPPQVTATDQCQGPAASCVAGQTTAWGGTSAILTPRCGRIFASACGPTFATAIDEGFTRWHRARLPSVTVADDILLTGPSRWATHPRSRNPDRARLPPLAEQFFFTFNRGDDWTTYAVGHHRAGAAVSIPSNRGDLGNWWLPRTQPPQRS